MRQKNHTNPGIRILPGIIMLAIAAFVFTACKKNATPVLPEKDEMQQAVELIDGQLLSGKLENGGMEENTVYLDFNTGKKAIFVQSIEGSPSLNIPSMENAILITSHHGIIIKNPNDNRVLLFPQNDTESIRKFQQLAGIFKKGSEETQIAGTILLSFNS